MAYRKKIALVFGTRPEAIKLAPVALGLKQLPGEFDVKICITAQHREMLDQVLQIFGIVPDTDLNLMTPNQTLAQLTANVIAGMDEYWNSERPDLVLVQGDTTTVFAVALSAFYRKIPVGHVEAGLRTFDKFSPFPEEINRVLATKLSDLHFAPTETSKENLLRDGIAAGSIHVTGNTVIDALLLAKKKVEKHPPVIPGLQPPLDEKQPIIAITGHRRENFGEGFEHICTAISTLAENHPNVSFVYPVHLNPNVREPVNRLLGGKPNVFLLPPLEYLPFVSLMMKSTLILTDSGGVQEEAPSLGKPVLVMRENTERPEAVTAGTVKLVGTDSQAIIREVELLLNDRAAYEKMATAVNPYGDGHATERIIGAIRTYFSSSR